MKPHTIKSKVIKIEAQQCRIHPHAQRDLLPSKLKELTEELDLDSVGVLHAVEYEINGETCIWIVDGQHRWRALIDLGLGEWVVDVKIHLEVKDDAGASALFLRLNNRAPVSPYAKFDNEYRARLNHAVEITDIAKAHHLKIAKQSGDRHLACITALHTVFDYDAGQTLADTLDIVVEAWGRSGPSLEGKIIEGLGLVFKTYNGSIERPVLVKKLAKYPGGPSRLLGDARGMREFRKASVSLCVAELVVELYNLGRRGTKLDPL